MSNKKVHRDYIRIAIRPNQTLNKANVGQGVIIKQHFEYEKYA